MQFAPTRLGTKLMIWIATTLSVLFLLFTLVLLDSEGRRNTDATRDKALIIGSAVEKTLNQTMNQGDMTDIQLIVEDVGRAAQVSRIRIINSDGRVTQSSSAREVGTLIADSLYQKAGKEAGDQWEMDQEAEVFRLLKPLPNSPSCVKCHDKLSPGAVLGYIDLSLSISDTVAFMAKTRRIIFISGLLMVVVVCTTLFILLHQSVLRHIALLSHAAKLMAQGRGKIAVDVDARDEIGDLGHAFNQMLVNVSDAQERNVSLIKGISDPLLTVNVDLTVTFMNEPLEEITGFKADEVVGHLTCRELLRCGECREGCLLQRIVQGKSEDAREKMSIQSRSGRKIPVVASDSPLKDSLGNIIGAISILRDVTKELEAQQKLADEVSWSGSVIKAVADPMFTVDADKNVTYINEKAAEMSGYRREEAIGQKCHRIFKSDICRESCLFDRSLRERSSVYGVERNLEHRDGLEYLTRASGSVLMSADNTNVGFLEILRDVTEEQRNVNRLFEVLKHVQEASDSITGMARDIVRNSDEQKLSIAEQSSSVKEVATTIEELDITSQQTAEKAEGVARAAQRTVEIALEGQRSVDENIKVMDTIRDRVESIAEQILDLSQQAQQIGSIVTAVTDLAEQTNLLALNAAIEAARAGEHGRGFTVVAMEVKKLAEQSQSATAKISALISEVQQAIKTCVQVTEEGARGVEDGVRLTSTAGETIQKVMGTINETVDAVQQISTIARQQSVGIQQVSVAMANINTGMNQTSKSAEQLNRSAEDFTRLSEQLNDVARRYKLV